MSLQWHEFDAANEKYNGEDDYHLHCITFRGAVVVIAARSEDAIRAHTDDLGSATARRCDCNLLVSLFHTQALCGTRFKCTVTAIFVKFLQSDKWHVVFSVVPLRQSFANSVCRRLMTIWEEKLLVQDLRRARRAFTKSTYFRVDVTAIGRFVGN